jgi:hypothetical protein
MKCDGRDARSRDRGRGTSPNAKLPNGHRYWWNKMRDEKRLKATAFVISELAHRIMRRALR